MCKLQRRVSSYAVTFSFFPASTYYDKQLVLQSTARQKATSDDLAGKWDSHIALVAGSRRGERGGEVQ